MSYISEEKAQYIKEIIDQEHRDNVFFKEFCEKFYKFTGLVFLKNIEENNSKKTLNYIAFKAFEVFAQKNNQINCNIYHEIIDNCNLQFLIIHSNDYPFIVKSLGIFFKNREIPIKEIVHPMYRPTRTENGSLKKLNGGVIDESLICLVLPKTFNINESLLQDLKELYSNLKLIVNDFYKMQNNLKDVAQELITQSNDENKNLKINDVGEFLLWLANNNFVFLGSRNFKAIQNDNLISFQENETSRLGVFKKQDKFEDISFMPALLTMECSKNQLLEDHLFHINKKTERSEFYRNSRIDSLKVLELDTNGNITGLLQIAGLFTSDFFRKSPLEVPYLKAKAQNVITNFGFTQKSHDGRVLKSIIDSISLDEFYYLSIDEITKICDCVLNMHDSVGIFTRTDYFGTSMSIMIYLPSHRYSDDLRDVLGKYFCEMLSGKLTSSYGFVGTNNFAKLVYVVSFSASTNTDIDNDSISKHILEISQTWNDQYQKFLTKQNIATYINFSKSYQQNILPQRAIDETIRIINFLNTDKDNVFDYFVKKECLHICFYAKNKINSLGDMIKLFSNFKINIETEKTYKAIVKFNSKEEVIYIYHYKTSLLDSQLPSKDILKELINSLYLCFNNKIEDDKFNSLIAFNHLNAFEVNILRAYSRYLKQIGFEYSNDAIAECLSTYPPITNLLINLFQNEFNFKNKDKSNEKHQIVEKIHNALVTVLRTEHDAIFRKIADVINATVRTNAYTNNFKETGILSFKIESAKIANMVQPVPLYEIFIYSSNLEGCHLRGGKVARGGIRWSDRIEDYRFEILGLMKAQMVKNSVIVPLGSKGGFVIKNYNDLVEKNTSKQELKIIVEQAYSSFIEQLILLTDNIVSNQIVSPTDVVCLDDQDPYLVVAADKGTATFSDLANSIAVKHNFWLNDAFASGGSNGYDHKKMAITAKGAWIAVKRHFWEIGIDPDKETISVIGVGDMSGDVFGNGMLLSKHIKVLACFNHMHIFIDPAPDIAKSYKERLRLFKLPSSAWSDYDINAFSEGGGVFSRKDKMLNISPQIAKMFNLSSKQITPNELIKKILQHKIDLIWFGGIGTFIKASTEVNSQINDKINDNLRVDANTIQAKVIGEGANLGLTQKARMEYARFGKINTDAIDNSAGVDCSDHEVNIKIFLQYLIEKKLITSKQCEKLLIEMKDDVSDLVLDDNKNQTLILSLMQQESKTHIEEYTALIKSLENNNFMPLRRDIEFIASNEELKQRQILNEGLSRPELAVILAYTKIQLYHELINSLNHDQCYGKTHYIKYFPKLLQEKFLKHLNYHPLTSEITATVLSNLMINRMGPFFAFALARAFRTDYLRVVQGFITVCEIVDHEKFWDNCINFKYPYAQTMEKLSLFQQAIGECVMIALDSKDLLSINNIEAKFDANLPFSIVFASKIKNFDCDIKKIQHNFDKLNLISIYQLFSKIKPNKSWQHASLLLLQKEMLDVLSALCIKDFNGEEFENIENIMNSLQVELLNVQNDAQLMLFISYALKTLKVFA